MKHTHWLIVAAVVVLALVVTIVLVRRERAPADITVPGQVTPVPVMTQEQEEKALQERLQLFQSNPAAMRLMKGYVTNYVTKRRQIAAAEAELQKRLQALKAL